MFDATRRRVLGHQRGDLDRLGPAVFTKTYLQAHRLDTEFNDRHFAPGAYLRTHADHDRNWS